MAFVFCFDTYFTEKELLIKLISSSKHYIGDMRISTLQLFDRAIDSSELCKNINNFLNVMNVDCFLRYEDDNGKNVFDYLVTGTKSYEIANLPSGEEQNNKRNLVLAFNQSDFSTVASRNRISNFQSDINDFKYIVHSKLQDDFIIGNEADGNVIKAGTKTSRAFNQVCHHYGVEKLHPEEVTVQRNGQPVTKTVYPYDKLFASYADIVSEAQRKLNFVISVNPLDYLTMSHGVNWKSCHNITSGGWKGGCLSYMLDSTSIITYVLTEMNNPIHEQPKVYRQMFHYDNGLFMQNRLYPQGNDGATDLYSKFRGFVVDEFNEILNGDGNWSVEVGYDTCTKHTVSEGVHYRDYHSNRSCSIFYPSDKYDALKERIMTIGHKGICVRCGREFTSGSRLCHAYLSECVL